MPLDHKHLLLTATVARPLVDVVATKDWLVRLVAALGMKVAAGPIAHYCTAQDNNGITGAVCIETSHCSIHVWDQAEVPFAQMDVYSCAAFEVDDVIPFVMEMEPYHYQWVLVDRNHALSVVRKDYKEFAEPLHPR